MNLLKGKVEQREGGLTFVEDGDKDKGAITIPLKGSAEKAAAKLIGKNVVFGIRPEHITNEVTEGTYVSISSAVEIAEPMGSESLVYMKAGTGNMIARIHGEHLFQLGELITVQLNMDKATLFDAETEEVVR
jgi:multiple sugar transport system ATP-binding protein